MAIFSVGESDETFFSKRKTWDFEEALETANKGDTIEFVEGFSPYYAHEKIPKEIIIKKDITLLGHIRESENGKVYTNVINEIAIQKGANVTLKNIGIKDNKEKSNCLNIRDNSCVILENVLIENESTSGENYPIVYISENSNVSFNNVTIKPSSNLDGQNIVFIINSILRASKCTINTGVKGNNAELNFEETLISNTDINGLYANNQSIVNLNSVRINGGKITQDTNWPCVKIDDSEGIFKDIIIEQQNYYAALLLTNSSIAIDNSRIDSLESYTSKINLKYTQILESFSVKDNSKIELKSIDILGKENGAINLFAGGNSSIDGNKINFGKESYPNIKLERNVDFNVEQINSLSYDNDKEDFQRDLNGNLIVIDKEIDIEYFGEKSASQHLDELIGIHSVKRDVEEFVAVAQMNVLREKEGFKRSVMSLHSLFLGNPGTGKTSVARIIGELLYEKNVTSKDIFVEVSRSDLVGNYVGHTATKTREALESALGGVLFIDEAYTLAVGGENDFGREAINEILSFMENYRSDIVIIFAGYTDDMNEFLKTNDGLKSRIPNNFDFPDYTIDELIQIGLINMYEQEYQINEETYRELLYNNYEHSYDLSNGRWVRNLNDQIIRRMAIRIMKAENPDVTRILDEDLDSLMI